MTLMEFFGCTFLAFGPPFAMFTFTIARDPIRIIILIASAFFWLLSLLLSSLLWFVLRPFFQSTFHTLIFGLVFSVILQELCRFLIYQLLKKAEGGLKKVTDSDSNFSSNRHILAYVSGLGFGVMSGAFALVNVLADATGPGTMGLKGGSDLFFLTSAATTLCFILLHTFWGVIAFSALDNGNYYHLCWVIGSHMTVSCLTLLNRNLMYAATLVPAYLIMIVTALIAYSVAGGTFRSFKASLLLNVDIIRQHLYEEIP